MLNSHDLPIDPATLQQAIEVSSGNLRLLLETAYAALHESDPAQVAGGVALQLQEAAEKMLQIEHLTEQQTALVSALQDKVALLIKQRDNAYREGYEGGMMHYAECDVCASDARSEFIAEEMMNADESPEAVAEGLRAALEDDIAQALEIVEAESTQVEAGADPEAVAEWRGEGESEALDEIIDDEEVICPNCEDNLWDAANECWKPRCQCGFVVNTSVPDGSDAY